MYLSLRKIVKAIFGLEIGIQAHGSMMVKPLKIILSIRILSLKWFGKYMKIMIKTYSLPWQKVVFIALMEKRLIGGFELNVNDIKG